MARRRQEAAVMQEIENQEEWDEMMAREGLIVIDVYQEWAGPCAAMYSTLKRLRNELHDDLLHLGEAKADAVDSLERYRGSCEPCYLFYAGAVLVAVVRGANPPVLLRTIAEQLEQEHKVLDGQADRVEIRDPVFAALDAELERKQREAEQEAEDSDDEGKPKEVTVCIIKPDVVKSDKVGEILDRLEDAKFDILCHEERNLTDAEAKEFYRHLEGEEYYGDLIEFMISDVSHMLVLSKGETGEGVIDSFNGLVGPEDTNEARAGAPESLRALYGEDIVRNALHASSDAEQAVRELAFFFPDFEVPRVVRKKKKPKEKTLAIIRPSAMLLYKDQILSEIKQYGLEIVHQKTFQLTETEAQQFYAEHHDESFFNPLIKEMTSGPMMALILEGQDAVESWRKAIGPKDVKQALEEAPESIRAKFKLEADDELMLNVVHGSDAIEAAQREVQFFFPAQQTLAVIKPDAEQRADEIITKIKQRGFKICARKSTIFNDEMVAKIYPTKVGEPYYTDLVSHLTMGASTCLLLYREDAIEGWRDLIGPVDPEIARQELPESLRAAYGTSILENAVHGSSKDRVREELQAVFDDMVEDEHGFLVIPPKVELPQQQASESTLTFEQEPVAETEATEVPTETTPAKESTVAESDSGSKAVKEGEEGANVDGETTNEEPQQEANEEARPIDEVTKQDASEVKATPTTDQGESAAVEEAHESKPADEATEESGVKPTEEGEDKSVEHEAESAEKPAENVSALSEKPESPSTENKPDENAQETEPAADENATVQGEDVEKLDTTPLKESAPSETVQEKESEKDENDNSENAPPPVGLSSGKQE